MPDTKHIDPKEVGSDVKIDHKADPNASTSTSNVSSDTHKPSWLDSLKLRCHTLYQNWKSGRPERQQRRQERRLQRRQERQQLRLQCLRTPRDHFSVSPIVYVFAATMLLYFFGGEQLEDYPAIHWFAESFLRLVEALIELLKDALEWVFTSYDANPPAFSELFGEPLGKLIHTFFEWCRAIFGM